MASSNVDLHQLRLALDKVLQPVQHLFISPERLTDYRIIARGGFGSVSAAHLRAHPGSPDFEIVAVKKIFPAGNDEQRINLNTSFARELKVWSKVDHFNVLPLRGYFLDTEADIAMFISSFESRGNLCQYLERANPDNSRRLGLAIDTASGLFYLHTHVPPICHGDIKSLNVLITADGRAKLCDFGLAKIIEEHPSGLTTTGFNEAGTVRYISQELVCVPGARRTVRSDVWAWGGVSLEIFTGLFPYSKCSTMQVYGQLFKGVPPAPLETLIVSDRIRNLLRQCWEREPDNRITMSESCKILAEEKLSLTMVPADENTLSSIYGEPLWDLKAHETEALQAIETYRLGEGMIAPLSGRSLYRGGFTHSTMLQAFRWAPIGASVAVQTLRLHSRAAGRIDELRRMKVWTRLNHPNIHMFLGFDLEEGQLQRVSSWMANGNLQAYLRLATYSHAEKIGLSADVGRGLLYLHSQNPPIVHGNLRAHSILIDSAGHAILSDFLFFETVPDAISSGAPGAEDTLRWSAPELIEDSTFFTMADMWAWGCLLIEIFLGSIPFAGLRYIHAVLSRLSSQQPPAHPKQLSPLPMILQQHMGACWEYEPTRRPAIQDGLDVLTQLPEHWENASATSG